MFHSHQLVSPEEAVSPKVRLPAPEEIPHIDLQVVNYHEAWLGTLHSKLMIVDRKFALLESNNIQVSVPFFALNKTTWVCVLMFL